MLPLNVISNFIHNYWSSFSFIWKYL